MQQIKVSDPAPLWFRSARVQTISFSVAFGEPTDGSSLEALCVSYLLAVIKHSEEEHGHQEQRRLFGPQEVSVGAAAEKKLLKEFHPHDELWLVHGCRLEVVEQQQVKVMFYFCFVFRL